MVEEEREFEIREGDFSVQGIGVGVSQELPWASQVVIDDFLRVKEVQRP